MHISTETALIHEAGRGFEARYGRPPEAVAFAPGRVNSLPTRITSQFFSHRSRWASDASSQNIVRSIAV